MRIDYSGQNLRGRSFKGQNLTGANFSYADIRGTNFADANLMGANFSHAQAGLQPQQAIFLVIVSLLVSLMSGFISAFVSYRAAFILLPWNINNITIPGRVPGIILGLVLYVFLWHIIFRKGLGIGFAVWIVAAIVIVSAYMAVDTVFKVKENFVAVGFAAGVTVALLAAGVVYISVAVAVAMTVASANDKFAVVNVTESKSMTNSYDASRKIEIKARDINASGQAFNLGEISDVVTNTINQLPESSKPEKPGIKELLTQLQAEIEANTNLTEEDKAEALEQVKTLAEAGKNPQEGAMQKAAKTAMKVLKGTVAGLPATATLVEACSKLLPLISKFLGLG
jgi:hypothetical protein